jgi:hypothetical protein
MSAIAYAGFRFPGAQGCFLPGGTLFLGQR